MIDEDQYSNKDSNHNAEVDRRESSRIILLVIVASAIIVFIVGYYYKTTTPPPSRVPLMTTPTAPSPPQPVIREPNRPHLYDHTKPPHEQ
jgi:hypothetical protein